MLVGVTCKVAKVALQSEVCSSCTWFVRQDPQSDGAPQTSDTAARPAAAREAAAEQMQGPVILSGNDVEAGKQVIQQMPNKGVSPGSLINVQDSMRTIQQMPNKVVSFEFCWCSDLCEGCRCGYAGATGKDAPGKKQEAGKKRKYVPSGTDDAGALSIRIAHECASRISSTHDSILQHTATDRHTHVHALTLVSCHEYKHWICQAYCEQSL